MPPQQSSDAGEKTNALSRNGDHKNEVSRQKSPSSSPTMASSSKYAQYMQPETANTFQGQATFDVKTMTEVKTMGAKKMTPEKSEQVRANRNMTCELHKRQKRKCDPETCSRNKRRLQQRDKNTPGGKSMRVHPPYGEDIVGNLGYGDDFQAIQRYQAGHQHKFLGSAEETELSRYLITAAPPSPHPSHRLAENVNLDVSASKEVGSGPFQSKGKDDVEPSQELVSNLEGQETGFRIDPTKAEVELWNQADVEYSWVPRSVWGGLSIYGHGKVEYSTNFNYVPDQGLSLFAPDYASQGNNVAKGGEGGEGVNGGDDRDGGDQDGNTGSGFPDYNEYGDYFKEYDNQWEDGTGGYGSGSGQPEAGGGYRKPGGGYYVFASEIEEKMAKMSLK